MKIRYWGLIGTCMYASVAADNVLKESSKDNTESLGYMLIMRELMIVIHLCASCRIHFSMDSI